MVLDQAIGAPIYIYTYYVITHFLTEYKTLLSSKSTASTKEQTSVLLEQTVDRANEMLLPTMLRHWSVWPLVHSLNFYYNPLHHRVLVQNLVLVGWSGCECILLFCRVDMLDRVSDNPFYLLRSQPFEQWGPHDP